MFFRINFVLKFYLKNIFYYKEIILLHQ